MTIRARLWGFQGSLGGNEDVIAEAQPFLKVEGENGVWVPVGPDWNGPGSGLHLVENPEEHGTSLAETHPPLVNPGEIVFLVGPLFKRRCQILGIKVPLMLRHVIDGFAIGVASSDTVRNARRIAAKCAINTFDDYVERGSPGTAKQQAAWEILNVDDMLDPLERLTRVLHGESLRGNDALITAAQVEAAGRGLEAELLVERTRVYAAALASVQSETGTAVQSATLNGHRWGVFGSSAGDAKRPVQVDIEQG